MIITFQIYNIVDQQRNQQISKTCTEEIINQNYNQRIIPSHSHSSSIKMQLKRVRFSSYSMLMMFLMFIMRVNSQAWWLRDKSNSTTSNTTINSAAVVGNNSSTSTMNSTQMLLVPVIVGSSVPQVPPCPQIYGQFCTNCDENQCLQCQSPNLTLHRRDPNSTATFFQACICQYPYVYNLTASVPTDYKTESTLYSSTYPCVLCTDKFTLQQCSPALFRYNISQVNTSTILMLAFNRDEQTVKQLGSNISTVARYWLTTKLMVDGTELLANSISDTACNISILFDNLRPSPVPSYCVHLTFTGLAEQAYQLYLSKNYTLTPTFRIGLFRRYDLYVNASGATLPQSYRSPIVFKSLDGYEPDGQSYVRDYSNLESIVYELPMYKPTVNTSNTSSSSTNSATNMNTSSSASASNSSSQSTSTTATASTTTSDSTQSQPSTPMDIPSNNYGILHQFSPTEQTIKTGIQIALFSLSSVGLAGVGASSWLTAVLGLTHLFGNLGLYSADLANYTDSMDQQPQVANSNSRLLLFQNLPNITVQFTDVSIVHSLAKVANLTLTLNPLILPTPVTETIAINTVLPTFSMSLFSTMLIVIGFMPVLTILLCYLRSYAKNKRQHQFSHIFTVLSDSGLLKRVLYMSLRGLYPLMAYTLIVFLQGLFEVGFYGFNLVVWDTWNILYATEMAIVAAVVSTLPIAGLCCFSAADRNNVHIYWRMHGKQLPQAQSVQLGQKQSNESENSSQHKIKPEREDQVKHECTPAIEDSHQQHEQQQMEQEQCHNRELQQHLQPGSFKMYSPSLLPTFYFIVDYLHMMGFMCVSVFAGADMQKYTLLALAVTMTIFTLYCYITVGVSKAYAVVRIVQMLLLVSLLVCNLLWDQYLTCSFLGLYILYAMSVWAIVHLLFLLLTMLYWELKGLGVHAYFLNKITPINTQPESEQQPQPQTQANNAKQVVLLEQVQHSNIFNSHSKQPSIRAAPVKKNQTAAKSKNKNNTEHANQFLD